MQLSSFERKFLRSICISAAIQGVVWTILSFVCIILHDGSHRLDPPRTYTEAVPYMLYYRFIRDLEADKLAIKSADFLAFMWTYFLSSAIWVVLSLDLYFGLHSVKKRLPSITLVWSILVISVSIIDITLMGLFVRDYRSCEDTPGKVFCFLVNAIGMTLAARGYVLWLLNVGAAYVMLTFGIKMQKENYLAESVRIPKIQVPSTDRLWMNRKKYSQLFADRSNNFRKGF